MGRKVLLIALFALAWPCAAGARPVVLMPGVTYERAVQWTGAGPVTTYVVNAPRPVGLYSLTPLLSNDAITGRETVSSMQRRVAGQMTTVGVNGDFFDWSGGWPSGLLMRGGVLEHHPATNRSAVGVDAAGTLRVDRSVFVATWQGVSSIAHPLSRVNEPPKANGAALFTPVWGASTPVVDGYAVVLEPFPAALPFRDLTAPVAAVVERGAVRIPRDGAVLVARGTAAAALREDAAVDGELTVKLALSREWSSVTDAVGGGPALVHGGKIVTHSAESLTGTQLFGREPRTAIGQRADGGVVLVAADGRRPGWSVGITNGELALTLIRYGCTEGFALDSGGSTTVAFAGAVLNRPSDTYGERPVAEALVVGYTGVFAPAPATTLSPNGDGYGDRETLSYKVVRPATVSAKLVMPDGSERELDAGTKPPGTYRLTWDGTDPTGAPMAEGRYRWRVEATDDLGRGSTAERTFTLDNTLGFVRVGKSARAAQLQLSREASIRVRVQDRRGVTLRTIGAGRRPPGPVTLRWNGRDGRGRRAPSGAYVLDARASSVLGLSAVRVPFRITG